MLRWASIDIGIHNSCVVVEEFDPSKLRNLDRIAINKRYDNNGEPTREFSLLLNQIYKNGNLIFSEKVNLFQGKKFVVDDEVLKNLSKYITTLTILDSCDTILIEKQVSNMMVKKKMDKVTNSIAIRLEHHIQSVLLEKYNFKKKIYIYAAKNKTQIIGAPYFIKDKSGKMIKLEKKRKQWACAKAKEIVLLRKDEFYFDKIFIENYDKMDDFSDCILMLQSAKYKYFCDKPLVCSAVASSSSNGSSRAGAVAGRELDMNMAALRVFVSKKGGILTGGCVEPIEVRCRMGHTFSDTMNNIKLNWCGECTRVEKLQGFQKCCDYVRDVYNGLCLYDKKSFIREPDCKYEFKCANNHSNFWKTIGEITNGEWCPTCTRNIGVDICEFYFTLMYGKNGNDDGEATVVTKLDLDYYSKQFKIGFIYSNTDHTQYVEYYHKKPMRGGFTLNDGIVELYKPRDELQIIKDYKKNGVDIILIPYTVPYSKLIEFIQNATLSLNRKEEPFEIIEQLPKCLTNLIDPNLDYVKELLYSRGGVCLSKTSYGNPKMKLLFRCQHNVVFEQTTDKIKSKIKKNVEWCPCKVIKEKVKLSNQCAHINTRGKKINQRCISMTNETYCKKHRAKANPVKVKTKVKVKTNVKVKALGEDDTTVVEKKVKKRKSKINIVAEIIPSQDNDSEILFI